jgi:hypothetical protein
VNDKAASDNAVPHRHTAILAPSPGTVLAAPPHRLQRLRRPPRPRASRSASAATAVIAASSAEAVRGRAGSACAVPHRRRVRIAVIAGIVFADIPARLAAPPPPPSAGRGRRGQRARQGRWGGDQR